MASEKASEVITLGGKGSSLSSSSLYAIATGFASLRLDSSALDRLSSPSSNHAAPPVYFQFPIPKTLSPLELRAFLTVLLYKLLRSDHSTLLPIRISEALNKFKNETLEFDSIELSKEELSLVESLYPTSLFGVSALLGHESAALSAVSHAVAALSCEAIKADVAAVFNSMDCGDGFSAKEEVASHMKALLNGSKLVGKVEIDSVSKIAKVHGRLRDAVKFVHSKARIELNSKDLGSGSDVDTVWYLHPLAVAINELGECSLSRLKANLDSISNEDLRSSLVSLFEGKCASGESLRNGFKLVWELGFEKEYEKFVHQVNVLLGMVAWEAMTGFIALEGVEWSEKSGSSVEVNGGVGGGNVKGDKKGEKKKKVLLGKGTRVILQLIKDRLQVKAGDGIEKWVDSILLFLDPKGREFDSLLKKLKSL